MGMIKSIIKQYLLKKKNYFLITTHGNTASLWLASALNQYPGVFCTHGYDYPFPATGIEPREITAEEQAKRGRVIRERFYDLSLAEFFHETQSVTSKPILGNVHAYTISRLIKLLPHFSEKHRQRLKIFNMVRHPVTRINSMYKMFVDEEGLAFADFVERDFETRCEHLRGYLAKYHSIEITNKVKAFVVSILALEAISSDVMLANQYGIENISFERVTTDSAYFTELLRKIVNLYCEFKPEIAEAIFAATPKINRHNNDQNLNAQQQYAAWLPWQQDLYRYMVQRMGMNDIYTEFGYELMFDVSQKKESMASNM